MQEDFRYHVKLVDEAYYRNIVSCQAACPVHTNASGYVNAVAEGDYRAGYIQAREPNPFASVCGRVCAAHCEKACRRGKIDAPITIRALKRFLCERFGVEVMSRLPVAREERQQTGRALLTGPVPDNTATIESFSQLSKGAAKDGSTAVAVIGAGPSGLTAAHDLAILGYKVTVFEATSELGGMLRLGIPEYRLPRDLLSLEIEEILELGVETRLNTRLGEDFSLNDLKNKGFQAIFITIGAHKDRSMDIEGIHLDGVVSAVDFLLNVNMGYRVNLGDSVVVVGGGDVAIDAARVAARLGEVYDLVTEGTLATVVDAARNALRLGVKEVHIVYRGTREEMRASQEELEGALDEGIILHTGLIPGRILGSHGKVIGLETIATRSVYDENGRRTLDAIPGSESIITCSSVIAAIGQESDLSFIRPEDDIAITTRNTILVDPQNLATTAPGIFAGGDVVYGPRTIIEAVADGHQAARAIDQYLKHEQRQVVEKGWMVEATPRDLPLTDHRYRPRINPAKISLDRRTGISEVETVFGEDAAREQASRCLRCNIQTVFDADLCILCGGCVDVCPWNCYKMVKLDKIDGDEKLREVIKARYGITLEEFQRNVEARDMGTAMIKDETYCTRCGLCAERCPTGAITMENFHFNEELVTEK